MSPDTDEFRDLILTWPSRAIRYLYEHYHITLVQIAERRTHNRKASEDIVQEAFINFWRNSERLYARAGFLVRPYLMSYVKKKSISWYHQSSRRPSSPLNDLREHSSVNTTKEFEIFELERSNSLKGIVLKLPPRQRQCVLLRFFEEMSIGCISVELGISKKAVEKNITRGLKTLRNYRSAMLEV